MEGGSPTIGYVRTILPILDPDPTPVLQRGRLWTTHPSPAPTSTLFSIPAPSPSSVRQPTPPSRGHTYVSALREFGFQGQVYPINPKAEEVAGYTCYPSLKHVPGPVDYVISAVPAPLLPQVIKDARGKQVKGIHLFTARMAEMATEEGLALEAGIIRSAREIGARIIGPNCMGYTIPVTASPSDKTFRSSPAELDSSARAAATRWSSYTVPRCGASFSARP